MTAAGLVAAWRQRQSFAFDLAKNSSARRTVTFPLGGRDVTAYANANLSVISPRECNATCPFCVEKLRPASRGRLFERMDRPAVDDYLGALNRALAELAPLNPSVSITGGEPSLDPALPAMLDVLRRRHARKMTITTNGSGLFHMRDGLRIIEWIATSGVKHLNISRACVDDRRNAELMKMTDGLDANTLGLAVRWAKGRGVRPRLSCALIDGEVAGPEGILEYLSFAKGLGADNVVFRELMKPDAGAMNPDDTVARYCGEKRISLAPILEWVSQDPRFSFVRQVMGYYYYVEVWRLGGMDVVFEAADLGRIETAKIKTPGLIHELVFHPDGTLASTWRAREGIISTPLLR
jgi:molybdenum cofactor biosynthesis enzyme MoaA